MSYRVALLRWATEIPGWALNLSRGGIRAIVEERLTLGEELEVCIEEIQVRRQGRVVWTQDEPDGTIVGISFVERLQEPPPGVELDSSLEIAPSVLAAKLGMTEDQLRAALDDTDPMGDPQRVPQTPPATTGDPSATQPPPAAEPDPDGGP